MIDPRSSAGQFAVMAAVSANTKDQAFLHLCGEQLTPLPEIGEVAGHLHPVARVASRHRTLRRKCFVTDEQRLIMPAMGAFTGGLNILHDAFDAVFPGSERQVFVIGPDRIYPVSRQHLVDDGPRKKWRTMANESV